MGSEGRLQRIFAPWRLEYVSRDETDQGCIFCAAARGGEDALTLTVGERAFALLNRFPYTSGHAMVAPLQHAGSLAELDAATMAEMMVLARRVMAALEAEYQPHGFNLGMNLGEAAGAGIVDHVHLHVVPRWRGDTNFMTVGAEVRVLPEDLTQSCARLRRALEAQGG